MLEDISLNLQKQYQVTLQVKEEAEKFLAHTGYSPQFGARELRRTVERLIQVPLSQLILSGEIKKHKNWQVICSGDVLSIVPRTREASTKGSP